MKEEGAALHHGHGHGRHLYGGMRWISGAIFDGRTDEWDRKEGMMDPISLSINGDELLVSMMPSSIHVCIVGRSGAWTGTMTAAA